MALSVPERNTIRERSILASRSVLGLFRETGSQLSLLGLVVCGKWSAESTRMSGQMDTSIRVPLQRRFLWYTKQSTHSMCMWCKWLTSTATMFCNVVGQHQEAISMDITNVPMSVPAFLALLSIRTIALWSLHWRKVPCTSLWHFKLRITTAVHRRHRWVRFHCNSSSTATQHPAAAVHHRSSRVFDRIEVSVGAIVDWSDGLFCHSLYWYPDRLQRHGVCHRRSGLFRKIYCWFCDEFSRGFNEEHHPKSQYGWVVHSCSFFSAYLSFDVAPRCLSNYPQLVPHFWSVRTTRILCWSCWQYWCSVWTVVHYISCWIWIARCHSTNGGTRFCITLGHNLPKSHRLLNSK